MKAAARAALAGERSSAGVQFLQQISSGRSA